MRDNAASVHGRMEDEEKKITGEGVRREEDICKLQAVVHPSQSALSGLHSVYAPGTSGANSINK